MEKRPGAARRLAAWNDGDTESYAPFYGPDALDWQLDLRFILAEFKEIETESARVTKGYEALNGIIASMRSLDNPRLAFADAAEKPLPRVRALLTSIEDEIGPHDGKRAATIAAEIKALLARLGSTQPARGDPA